MAKILVVDDAAFMRMMVRMLYRKADIRMYMRLKMERGQWKNTKN